ncbi:unnamed protein product [Rhizoctonia solani]|uniref:Uncharacterized protein n=1 Tax=Rhizoctonia solani TaxID=456999 RepID=A0A8H3HTX8_9AGAM|nr:unnamed protein product [Rhizoctonia solani]
MGDLLGKTHVFQSGMDGPGPSQVETAQYLISMAHEGSRAMILHSGYSSIFASAQVFNPLVGDFELIDLGDQQDPSALNQESVLPSKDSPSRVTFSNLVPTAVELVPTAVELVMSTDSSSAPFVPTPLLNGALDLSPTPGVPLPLDQVVDTLPSTPSTYSAFDDPYQTSDFAGDADDVSHQLCVLEYNDNFSSLASARLRIVTRSTPVLIIPSQADWARSDGYYINGIRQPVLRRVRREVSYVGPPSEVMHRIKHYLTEQPVPCGDCQAPKRPDLGFLGLIEKYSSRIPSVGKFNQPESSSCTTNYTRRCLPAQSSCYGSPTTPVVVDPYSPSVQPLSTPTPKSTITEMALDSRIDPEGMLFDSVLYPLTSIPSAALPRPSPITNPGRNGLYSVLSSATSGSLPSNDASESPSLVTSTESPPPLSIAPLPNKSPLNSEEGYLLDETHRLAYDSLIHGHEATPTQSSAKAAFLQGLSALAEMLPSVSPRPHLRRIKLTDAGYLCAPDREHWTGLDPIDFDGSWIGVEGLNNPLFKGFVGYHFLSPSRANIVGTLFHYGSLVIIDLAGYNHELCKCSRLAILRDEHNDALPMLPERPETVKVVDAPIIAPYKIEEDLAAPLPTTIDDLRGHPTIDDEEIVELHLGPPGQNKIFGSRGIGNRVEHIHEHSPGPGQVGCPSSKGIRKERHPGTSAIARRDLMRLPSPRRCRWLNGRKRPKCQSCLAPSSHFRPPYRIYLPELQPVKGYSAGNGEPSGSGDLLDLSSYLSGFGDFLNISGSTNEGVTWSGPGPGSELQQGLEMSDESLQFLLNSIEPAPNLIAPQPQYYDADNPPVQQPLHVTPPPVPLSVSPQLNTPGPEWAAIEPAPNVAVPQPQYRDGSGPAMQQPYNTPPLAPLPVNPQPDTHGPECRTSAGPPNESRLQPGSTGSSMVAPLVPTTVVPNADVQSFPTAADLDRPIAPPFTPHALQVLAVRQPSPSTTQMIAPRDMSNGDFGFALVNAYIDFNKSLARYSNRCHLYPSETDIQNEQECFSQL